MSTLRPASNNPARLLAEARMINTNSGRHLIVVEGETDFRFFYHWINHDAAYIKQVDGKPNVEYIWQEAKRKRFFQLTCFADLDFDYIIDKSPIKDERFLYISFADDSDGHEEHCNDLEVTLLRSPALDKVLIQRVPIKKMSEGDFSEYVSFIRERLRSAATTIGAYRAANQAYNSDHGRAPLGKFAVESNFFDAEDLTLRVDSFQEIMWNRFRPNHAEIKNISRRANDFLKRFDGGWNLCRGHDMCEMLSMHLSQSIGRHVSPKEIESALREAFDPQMAVGEAFWQRLKARQAQLGQPVLKF